MRRGQQPRRPPCTGSISSGRTYVFPAVTINCTGTLEGLAVKGERSMNDGSKPVIQVWRMHANVSGLYTLEHSIPLGSQCCSIDRGSKATCTTSFRVMAGDIIGIWLHVRSPRNYFLNVSHTTRAYCLPERAKNFSIENSDNCLKNVLPLISMKISPG